MNKPSSHQACAQIANLVRSAAEASHRYADRFRDLHTLARLLQNAVEREQIGNGEPSMVAAIIIRLSDEYANFAQAEAEMFAAVARIKVECESDDIAAGMARTSRKH